jgi:hypothetical protein
MRHGKARILKRRAEGAASDSKIILIMQAAAGMKNSFKTILSNKLLRLSRKKSDPMAGAF